MKPLQTKSVTFLIKYVFFAYLYQSFENETFSMPYLSITKAQICESLGLVYSSGRLAYNRLKYFFTPQVLERLQIPPDQFKRMRRFSAHQSEMIMIEFDLNPNSFENRNPTS